MTQNEMREFDTGATRDSEIGKLDFEGFLSPCAMERYAEYMNSHRVQADGKLRDSDNWQKGIPIKAYMKSLWRHFFDIWKIYRNWRVWDKKDGHEITHEEALCGVIFNAFGYLHVLTDEPSRFGAEDPPEEESAGECKEETFPADISCKGCLHVNGTMEEYRCEVGSTPEVCKTVGTSKWEKWREELSEDCDKQYGKCWRAAGGPAACLVRDGDRIEIPCRYFEPKPKDPKEGERT